MRPDSDFLRPNFTTSRQDDNFQNSCASNRKLFPRTLSGNTEVRRADRREIREENSKSISLVPSAANTLNALKRRGILSLLICRISFRKTRAFQRRTRENNLQTRTKNLQNCHLLRQILILGFQCLGWIKDETRCLKLASSHVAIFYLRTAIEYAQVAEGRKRFYRGGSHHSLSSSFAVQPTRKTLWVLYLLIIFSPIFTADWRLFEPVNLSRDSQYDYRTRIISVNLYATNVRYSYSITITIMLDVVTSKTPILMKRSPLTTTVKRSSFSRYICAE